jgi:hypothetical protein
VRDRAEEHGIRQVAIEEGPTNRGDEADRQQTGGQVDGKKGTPIWHSQRDEGHGQKGTGKRRWKRRPLLLSEEEVK